MMAQEADDAPFVLEVGNGGVEIHPVDTLHFEGHVLTQDLGKGLG